MIAKNTMTVNVNNIRIYLIVINNNIRMNMINTSLTMIIDTIATIISNNAMIINNIATIINIITMIINTIIEKISPFPPGVPRGEPRPRSKARKCKLSSEPARSH